MIVAASGLNKFLQNIAIEASQVHMFSQVPYHEPILFLICVGLGNDTWAFQETMLDLISVNSLFLQ